MTYFRESVVNTQELLDLLLADHLRPEIEQANLGRQHVFQRPGKVLIQSQQVAHRVDVFPAIQTP